MNFFSFSKTQIGTSHTDKGTVCEDASGVYADEKQRFYIAVVSDGHGDSRVVRSDVGSRLACAAALGVLRRFAEETVLGGKTIGGVSVEQRLSIPKDAKTIAKELSSSIIYEWNNSLNDDLRTNPFTEEELAAAEDYRDLLCAGGDVRVAYGATLIAGLWLPGHLILLHQGDGHEELFLRDGSVLQPVPWDETCFENVTSSLCDPNVAETFRSCVVDLAKTDVAACFVASDGIECFAGDDYNGVNIQMDGMHAFYKRLLIALTEKTPEEFDTYLGEVFDTLPSRDDISVAGIVSIADFTPLKERFADDSMRYDKLNELVYGPHGLQYVTSQIQSKTRNHGILKEKLAAAEAALAALQAEDADCERKMRTLDAEKEHLEQAKASADDELNRINEAHSKLTRALDEQDVRSSLQMLGVETGEGGVISESYKKKKGTLLDAIKECFVKRDSTETQMKRLEERRAELAVLISKAQEALTEARTKFTEFDEGYTACVEKQKRLKALIDESGIN